MHQIKIEHQIQDPGYLSVEAEAGRDVGGKEVHRGLYVEL